MKSILTSLVLVYGIACLGLFLLQRTFLYFPQPSYPVKGAKPVQFKNQKQLLSGWLINPEQDKLIIYYGGNAETVELNQAFFESLLPEWSVLLLPYRGYGGNPGKPNEEGLCSDALLVFDQISSNYTSTLLMGRSLGSGVATYVASKRETNGLILITPYDSIVNVAKEHYGLFPVKWLVTDRYDSHSRASQITIKVLMLIAEHDRVISRARSDALAQAFNTKQLTRVVVKDSDHNNIGNQVEYAAQLRRFVDLL